MFNLNNGQNPNEAICASAEIRVRKREREHEGARRTYWAAHLNFTNED